MKKLIASAALVAAPLLAFTGHASAQTYVTLGIGSGHLNVDCEGLSCDKQGTAGKIVGGYTFNNGFAVEAGYFQLGRAKASERVSGIAVGLDAKSTGFALGLAYQGEIAKNWTSALRAGFGSNKVRLTASAPGTPVTVSDSETSTQPYFGFGVGYAVSPTVSVGLDFDGTRIKYDGETANVRVLTAALQMRF